MRVVFESIAKTNVPGLRCLALDMQPPRCAFPDRRWDRQHVLEQFLSLLDIRPGEEPAVDRYHRFDHERCRRNLDRTFLVHERAMGAICSPDRRPQRLLAMQPARVPAAWLAPCDAVAKGLDRTRKLKRLRFQRGAGQ